MNRSKQIALEECMPHPISPSSSMLRMGQQSGDQRVSYCKKSGHEREEIEGACYQCADTFCKYCIEAHKDHYLIFFQDSYLKNNYESVQQIPTDIQADVPGGASTWPRESNSAYLGGKAGKLSFSGDSGRSSAKKNPSTQAVTDGPAATSTEEPTDSVLMFAATANHLNLPGQGNGQPKL